MKFKTVSVESNQQGRRATPAELMEQRADSEKLLFRPGGEGKAGLYYKSARLYME